MKEIEPTRLPTRSMERREGAVGALGALMDELERAAGELGAIVDGLSEEQFEAVRVADPAVELRSIQEIVHHVVRAGYAHANHVRVAFSLPGAPARFPLGARTECAAQLRAMLDYMEETLAGRWRMTDEEMDAVEIKSRWGPTYDLEQMLEHAIVHVLRHRRQIERFLGEPAAGNR